MKYMKQILTRNDCYRSGKPMKPTGVMVHSTGANNPTIARYVPIGLNIGNTWDKPGLKKCVHAFIGKDTTGQVAVCQTLPYTMKGWHAGSPKAGKVGANNTHIGFECCEDDLKNENYFWQVYITATEFVADLCKQFKLDPVKPGVVISHHEGHMLGIASNHGDIDHWLKVYGLTMDDFRKEVKRLMTDKVTGFSDWAVAGGVPEWVKETGISDGSRPQEKATREEVLLMLKNFENYITKKLGKEG